MDDVKGFAEIAKHLLYETLGLLVPGAAFVTAIVIAVGGDAPDRTLVFASAHHWLAVLGTYVVGYVVQGISRPITTIAERVLQSPAMLLRLIGRAGLGPSYKKCAQFAEKLENALLKRHAHAHGRVATQTAPSFDALLRGYWSNRLALHDDIELAAQQVTDLSFSALLSERERLDRFRAAASLARGVAVATVAAMVAVIVGVVHHLSALSWRAVGITEVLIVTFYALMERADMYNRMWKVIVPTQFLATITAERPLRPMAAHLSRASGAPPTAAPSGLMPERNGAGHVQHLVEAAPAEPDHG